MIHLQGWQRLQMCAHFVIIVLNFYRESNYNEYKNSFSWGYGGRVSGRYLNCKMQKRYCIDKLYNAPTVFSETGK